MSSSALQQLLAISTLEVGILVGARELVSRKDDLGSIDQPVADLNVLRFVNAGGGAYRPSVGKSCLRHAPLVISIQPSVLGM